MTERHDRLTELLEAFVDRDMQDLRATMREIVRAISGHNDEPGLVHIVKREIVPRVEEHHRTLYGASGDRNGGGLVVQVRDNRRFVDILRRLGWVVTGVLVVQTVAFLAWLVREVLRVSGGGG